MIAGGDCKHAATVDVTSAILSSGPLRRRSSRVEVSLTSRSENWIESDRSWLLLHRRKPVLEHHRAIDMDGMNRVFSDKDGRDLHLPDMDGMTCRIRYHPG